MMPITPAELAADARAHAERCEAAGDKVDALKWRGVADHWTRIAKEPTK